MGDRLKAVILLLGVCSFLACATALLAPWHYICIEWEHTEEDYESTDGVYHRKFLIDKTWTSIWYEYYRSPYTFYSSYSESPFSAVENLFDVVEILCLCGLVVIAMSTVAALKTSWRYCPVLAMLAPVLAVATILLFSLSFPSAMSEGFEETDHLIFGYSSDEIDGLYGSEELYFEYDDADDKIVRFEWSVDIAWWMMIGAFSMTLAQAILIGLHPPSGESLKTVLLGGSRRKKP